MYNTSKKKIRGQRRKLNNLINLINEFRMVYPYYYQYDHFHVPCEKDFIDSPQINNFVKKSFCQAWIDKTELFIKQKLEEIEFCKIVCVLDIKSLWNSQIIIFYDEFYYDNFGNWNDEFQRWIPLQDLSFKKEKALKTDMEEVGFKEIIVNEDESYLTELWFYGELTTLSVE